MSLQVQSSQQPTAVGTSVSAVTATSPTPSGRRTPHSFQNFAQTGGGGSTTNGNSKTTGGGGGPTTAQSKLSLKASTGGKQSPRSTTPQEQISEEASKMAGNVATINLTKLDAAASVVGGNVATKADKTAAATNNSGKEDKSTNGEANSNGTHAPSEKNGKPDESPKSRDTTPLTEKEKKIRESPRSSPRVPTPQKQQPAAEQTPQSKGTTDAGQKESPATPDAASQQAAKKKDKTAQEDEDMEVLLVEPSEYEDSPMPPRSVGKTKLLKYAGGGPPSASRTRPSPLRLATEIGKAKISTTNSSNLSTVAEGQLQSNEEASPVVPAATSSPSLDFNRPLRSISGRRATRPLSDIQYTYRSNRSAEFSNESISSLNATVGSEIPNDDSLLTGGRTPGSVGRKRRGMTPESTSDAHDIKEVTASPKRSRLDLSGFLGIVASPVTMLKNRLSRVQFSSTPKKKCIMDVEADEDDLTRCVRAEATTTVNISSGTIGEAAAASVGEKEGTAAMEVDEDKPVAADDAEKPVTAETGAADQANVESDAKPATATATAEAEDEEPKDVEEAVEVKDVTDKQRSFCVVM